MRSFFIGNEKRIKAIYRVLTVFLAVCWSILAICIAYSWFERNYLYPLKHQTQICYYADNYGIDRALIFAVVKTESSFNERAKSNKGAKGLMQITDSTGEYLASLIGLNQYDLFDIEDNLNLGCYYINRLIKQFGEQETALIAYNAGEGNVREWLKKSEYSKDGKRLIKIPFTETAEYIKKIKQNFTKYKKIYRNILDKR